MLAYHHFDQVIHGEWLHIMGVVSYLHISLAIYDGCSISFGAEEARGRRRAIRSRVFLLFACILHASTPYAVFSLIRWPRATFRHMSICSTPFCFVVCLSAYTNTIFLHSVIVLVHSTPEIALFHAVCFACAVRLCLLCCLVDDVFMSAAAAIRYPSTDVREYACKGSITCETAHHSLSIYI